MEREMNDVEESIINKMGGAKGVLERALALAEADENYEVCIKLKDALDNFKEGECIIRVIDK